ncbi:hypothetical protein D3C78_1208990 [compost metagenome]
MAQGFGFAVAGDFGEGSVHCADVLLRIGDQHAFGSAFEHGGGLLQFFLHEVALGDVPGDGQHAVFVADGQRAAGDFAQPDLPVVATDMAAEIPDEAVPLQQVEHLLSLVEVDPDAQVQGGAVHRQGAVEAGNAAEAFVDFDQQAVALPGQQQAIGRGVERLGKLLFGGLQLLLGFLELTDVPYHHDQGWRRVEVEGLGGDQPGEHLAIATAEGHFQVADAAGLQTLQQARPHALDTPDIQFGCAVSHHLGGTQTDLFFEGLVNFQQASVQ